MVSASLQHRGRRGVPYQHRKAQRPLSEPSGFAREPEARGGEEGVRRGEGGKGRNDKTNMRSNACVLLAACGFPNRCRCPSVNSPTRGKPYHTPQQGGENERAWQVLCRKRHNCASPATWLACLARPLRVGSRDHMWVERGEDTTVFNVLLLSPARGSKKRHKAASSSNCPTSGFPPQKLALWGFRVLERCRWGEARGPNRTTHMTFSTSPPFK